MDESLTRRGFMSVVAAGAACAACGPVLQGCAALLGPLELALRAEPGGGFRVRLADLSRASGAVNYVRVEPDGLRLLAIPEAGGAWRVLGRRCTHAGGLVRWSTGQKRFICPRHGSEFDRDGTVLQGPAVRPLPEYEAAVEGDVLHVGA